MDRVVITEEEAAALICMTGENGQVLSLPWGSNQLTLEATPENRWALEAVAWMRGVVGSG